MNKGRMQNFSNLCATVRDLGAAREKFLLARKKRTLESEKGPHAKRGCGISAFLASITRMAQNMMNREMEKKALRSQQEFVALAVKGNILSGMSNTKGHTSHVFATTEKRTLSPRTMKEQNPS